MPIFGVDRERLVRLLQNLVESAVQHPAQHDNAPVGTTSMKATTGTTPPSGPPTTVPPLADAPPPDVDVADASPTSGTPSKAGARARPSSSPDLTAADAAGGSNIDQLRDIIFGGQMREYERRFARMEERLANDLTAVRDEVRDRCATLERYMHDELESLTVELRANQQSRAVEERRLSESIGDTAKATEERIAALNELVGRQYRELRAQLLEQTKAITDDIQRRHADLLALVERDAAELRDGKADRTALSALFIEVALRLRGESVMPGESGEPRQG
jgi:hypothetical protein